MNTFSDILSSGWVDALGWTLLHSLWQALITLGLIVGAMRLIGSKRSTLRYGIACLGLLFFVIMSVGTFIGTLAEYSSGENAGNHPVVVLHQTAFHESARSEEVALIPLAVSALERNIHWLVMAWAGGFFFFALRLSTGLWYTYRIRSTAQLADQHWQAFVSQSAEKLGITDFVRLAESVAVATPMVIGFMKPLILVPAGMLAGLTPTQLETVLLHELAHIRRKDFLVNFLQSIIETIFFFNPFVWILSNEIRKEREYCCDDLVIRQHADTSAYAHALVKLAEGRLAAPLLALPLMNDKNILLHRIKRILEKSIKHSGKSRLIFPAIILILGLISISWIAVEKSDGDPHLAATDTVPDKKMNGARYSRRSIITIDENGLPHEEIVEEFEGDENLRTMMEKSMPPGFDSSFIAGFPDFSSEAFNAMAPPFEDTIPPFRGRHWEQWAESFNKNLEELLSLKGEHLKDLEKLMQEMEQRFSQEKWSEWEQSLRQSFHHDSLRALADSSAFRNLEQFKNLEEQLEKLRRFDSFEHFGDAFRSLERVSADERTLRDELVEDGYLSADEPINSLEWNEKYFKVNGKKVRPEHLKKYNELRESIFGIKGTNKAE